jgi:hypothetical protein
VFCFRECLVAMSLLWSRCAHDLESVVCVVEVTVSIFSERGGMGSGSSSLTEAQKRHVAKLMKEEYEKIVKISSENEVQAHMEKFYAGLILSLQTPTSLDGNLKDHTKKKTPTRRRSYGDDKMKKKNLPPKPPPIKATISSTQIGNGSHIEHQEHQHEEGGQQHLEETGKSVRFSLSHHSHRQWILGILFIHNHRVFFVKWSLLLQQSMTHMSNILKFMHKIY